MVKNLPASAGGARDTGLSPKSGRSPGGRIASHSRVLDWKMPRVVPATVHGVAKCWRQVSTHTPLHPIRKVSCYDL